MTEQLVLPGVNFNENKKKQVFKDYDTRKLDLLYFQNPGRFIPNNHIARLISLIVDNIDISNIIAKYKGGGASAYDPKMLLKVWLLGYYDKTFTTRKLEKALKENIVYMWISGFQFPDFRTLNNFRNKLENDIKDVFKQTVKGSIALGIITGELGNIDGTIVDANANKNKIIWGKKVKKAMEKNEKEINELAEKIFEQSKELQLEEDEKYGEDSITEENTTTKDFNVDDVLKIAGIVDKEIKGKRNQDKTEKEIVKNTRRLKKVLKSQEKWKEKEKKLDGKNSCAISDNDSRVFMNKKKILSPGYTETIISENQVVLNYEVDNEGERSLLKKTVEGVDENTGKKLKELVGDGGFGSEENYKYLEDKKIKAYVKYNKYYVENKKKWTQEKIRKETFKKINDNEYMCINGKKLKFKYQRKAKGKGDYKVNYKVYESTESQCKNCPYKEWCTKSKFKIFSVSEEYDRLKDKAKKILSTKRGKELAKRRGCDVETVFADRKYIADRYLLRGLNKVRIEAGIIYTVHNIKKIWKYVINNWSKIINYNEILVLNS